MPVMLRNGVIAWYLLLFGLAPLGVFERTVGGIQIGLWIVYAVPLTAYALMRRSPAVRDWMNHLDIRVLMVLHSSRWVAFGTLLLVFYRLTSPVWAVSAAVGDMTSAAALTYLAVRGFQTGRLQRAHVRFWNLFGLIDFAHAFTLVALLLPGPLGVLAGSTPTTTSAIAVTFPFVVVPILVPVLVSSHLIVLSQLRQAVPEIVFSSRSTSAPAKT